MSSGTGAELEKNLYDRLREALTEARRSAGLTQTQLAQRLDKPQSFISKYERGERRLDVIELIQVSRALEVDPLKLVSQLVDALIERDEAP